MNANRERRVRAGCSAAALALLLAVPAAHAGCQVSELEIPVRIVNQRPIGTLTLNGTEVAMLIDSGAFFSMLPLSTATQLGLKLQNLPYGMRIEGYTGAIEASMTKVDKVGLRGNELRNVEFIVGGNELGSGIQGVLGRNFLAAGDTEYDLAHGVVRLMFPKGDCEKTSFAYWAGDAPVIRTELLNNYRENNNDIRVTVQVNGTKLRAVMDTGAPTTSLKMRSARRAGVKDSDLKEIGRVGGAGEGRVRSWTAQLASFELGGETIANNFLQIDETDHLKDDMLIGLDYFLSHRIYVSRLQRQIYATWNGGAVFSRGVTDGVYDARYAAKPADLAPDDAEGLARRGEAAAARGEFKKALADLDRACELAPQSAANFLARAHVHAAMRQGAEARRDLDTALTLQPALHEARAMRAAARAAGGDRDGALADLAALDAALPQSANLRDNLGQVYDRLGMMPEALRQWDLWMASHRADARLANVFNARCWMRARANVDLKLALDDCKEAVGRDRGESAFHDSLGWVNLRLGDARAAVKAFDAAIEAKPRAISLYGRALARQRLGDTEAARRDLAAARGLDARIDAHVRRDGFPVAADAPPSPAPAAGGDDEAMSD